MPKKAKQMGLVPDTLICKHCGTEFTLSDSGKWRYQNGNPQKYCTHKCYHKDRSARAETTCQHCGKRFETYKKYLQRGQYKYCGTACRKAAFKKGIPDSERKRVCQTCNKEFLISPGEVLARKIRRHCSKKCSHRRNRMLCEWCGTEFEYPTAQKRQRRYCSRECYRKSSLPSRLELLVEYVLKEQRLSYKQEHRIGRFVVDFVLPDLMVAVEVDGEYWHDKAERWKVRREKETTIAAEGWTLVRLPQAKVERQAEIEILGSILRAIQGVPPSPVSND